jgi:hypothetical protein
LAKQTPDASEKLGVEGTALAAYHIKDTNSTKFFW